MDLTRREVRSRSHGERRVDDRSKGKSGGTNVQESHYRWSCKDAQIAALQRKSVLDLLYRIGSIVP